jgi:hypothetical protein
VYARVDTIEPGEAEGPRPPDEDTEWPFHGRDLLLLDSVDADWFDSRSEEIRSLADPEVNEEADSRVSVIAMAWDDMLPFYPYGPDEGAWMELRLEREAATPGPRVLHFVNLYAAPIEQTLLSVTRLPDRDHELARKTSMDSVPDASIDDIASTLLPDDPEAAAVYDVGQGNCTALIAGGYPRLYFDFGGGVLGNRKTFPQALSAFCFTGEPAIVLSHWDWDHWSSANRHPRAYDMTWIVPRQSNTLGAVHATFLGRLLQHGRVLAWPAHLRSLQIGCYELMSCTGARSSRNNSGLALAVEHTDTHETLRILFPGDCSYDHVPGSNGAALTSLVAAHHGGKIGSTFAPTPDGLPCGRLVYSYGAGNVYDHPTPTGRDLHNAWQQVLETPNRDASGLGHVHLYWDVNAPNATPACNGGGCCLTCHQR